MMTLTDTGEAMKPDEIYKLLSTSTLATKWGRDGEIGLMLAQGLVRHQGGWLAVTSTPEVGNEFSIYLPVSSDSEDGLAETPATETKSVGDPDAATILIVEDENSVREVMEYVLTSQGHNVLVAKDANEAWAQWRRRSMVIKLAIIDIKLPGGVSGFDLERALADEDPSLPVIFTCGYSQASLSSVRELKAGENFLPKPFGMVELLKIVGQALQRPTRFK
jgi:CheY-like chemotaxis protein